MLRDLLDHPRFTDLLTRLQRGTPATANGLSGGAFGLVVAAAAGQWNGPVVVVAAGPEEADAVEDDLSVFARREVVPFPAWDVLPTETDTPEMEVMSARVSALRRLTGAEEPPPPDANPPQKSGRKKKSKKGRRDDGFEGDPLADEENLPSGARWPLLSCSIQSLMQPVPSAAALARGEWVIRAGEEVPLLRLQHWLFDHGFERVGTVDTRGQFAIRGGIVDIYPLMGDTPPYRLEFFGEELESIRHFDPYTQRSTHRTGKLRLVGIDQRGMTDPFTLGEPSNLADALDDNAMVVLVEPDRIAERAGQYLDSTEGGAGLFTWEDVRDRLQRVTNLALTSQREEEDEAAAADFDVTSVQRFEGGVETFTRELQRVRSDEHVTIYCLNEAERHRLEKILAEHDIRLDRRLQLAIGHVSAGFHFRDLNRICLTDHELFGRYAQRRRVKRHPVAATTPVEHFLDLQPGDYVVHTTHGVARYVGLSALSKETQTEDYLTLLFADDVKVYVPAAHVHLIGKYVGMGESKPELSKVGGKAWARKKARAEKAIRDVAGELLEVQARRAALAGLALPDDDEWQREFEASFIYEETEDQLTAIEAIKQDQERVTPMDRLLCGDVGFGKTEVAVRAAFKAVNAGYQVAVLVPTTILAEQHGKTFGERMAGYPIRVDVLSRFRSTKEQKKVLREAATGSIDILIGTHRLLSKDVEFAKLGLVIVDEEQRFGVTHKEALKRHRATVDVLTLTATPIPRTLHMAMLGLRDISALTIPPEDRLAIRTKVCRYSEELVRRATLRELARGGQVYFVHNRVQDIGTVAHELKELIPEARIVVGHGQMTEKELARVMRAFIHQHADVLLSTTIIESGVDIPNANTIFINNANWFGLAEMHQLRGRVGRYKHRAYAYLMIPFEGAISEVSRRRLKAIEEFDELGAGFRLAMRDLEIRGAGNLLGAEQSGHIAEIGYDLYCRLLETTVKRLRGEEVKEPIEVTLRLGFPAFIAPDYMPDERQRLDLYRRINAITGQADAETVRDELSDRFGPPPTEVLRLIREGEVRHMAVGAHAPFVGVENGRLKLKLHGWSFADLEPRLKNERDVRVLSPEELTLPLPTRLRKALERLAAGGASSEAPARGPADADHVAMVEHVKRVLRPLVADD